MRFTKLVFLLVGLFVIAVAAVPLFAQTAGTGAIAGTVTDSTGAVIPGATVLATNADTGQQRTVTTGANGTYTFSLLTPGVYNVKFTANGFKVTEVSKLTVAVSETPVLDQKLDLGTQSEQVTVEANAEAIQTTNAALGTVIAGSQVVALPLASRNYTNILTLSAGVAASVTNASSLGKGGLDFSVNGAPTSSNNIQIDGANISSVNGSNSNTDQLNAYGSTPVPSPDALQEFKVQTSQYDAGYGRTSGANVNVITKTGTNAFHGSAFEFFRNTVLNANDFFLNRSGTGKGILNQNQFGGTLGGPIKKDKLFFFASYQGTTQKNGLASKSNSSVNVAPLSTGPRENRAAFRAALGAAFCPANHPGSTLYSTLRGGVQVACDGSTISDVALNMLQHKLPDGSYLIPGSTTGEFQTMSFSIPATYKENQELGNVDYLLSAKHTLALKFFNSYGTFKMPLAGTNFLPGFSSTGLYHDTTALTRLTSVLTPSMVNEARISWHRDVANFPGNTTGPSSHQFGMAPLSPYPDSIYPGYLTTLTISGAFAVGAAGQFNFAWSSSYTYQVADQISWTRGKHTVRAGFELEQGRWFRSFPGVGSGNLSIPSFADFLIGRAGCTPGDTACTATNPTLTNGLPNNGTAFSSNGASGVNTDYVGPSGNAHNYRIWNNNAFINDDFKLSPRLTLNLGLRYEFLGTLSDTLGNYSNIWPSAIMKVPVPGSTEATGTRAGWIVPANYRGEMLPGLTRATNNSSLESGPSMTQFAPRVGFAWQPFGGGKFVVRGGYGYFYDRTSSIVMMVGVNNAPPLATQAGFSGVGGYWSTLAQPFRPGGLGTYPVRWVDFAALTSAAVQQQTTGSNWRTPLVQQYNLNVQYNFLPTWVLEVGYVGNHGTNLIQQTGFNENSAFVASANRPIWGFTTSTVSNAILRVPYLGFGTMNTSCTCYSSKYNSLQVTLRKQFAHGFQAQAAYTWNKAMTTVGNIYPAYLGNPAGQYGANGRPQRLTLNYAWNLPFGNPRGVLGKLVTGWNLSGVTTIQSGSYLDITDGRGGTIYNLVTSRANISGSKTYSDIPTPGDLTTRLGGNSGGCGFFTRPNATGTLDGSTTCASLSPFIAPPSFVGPEGAVTNGTGQGNMGLGVLLGPGQVNFDASLAKMTTVGGLREDATLQFRAEFFNMFNHAQFSNPASNLSAGTFGQISSTTVNPRVIQLALKYVF